MDIICDIDGTVADLQHRRGWIASKPANWKAFRAGAEFDYVIEPVAQAVRSLFKAGNRIVMCSGRMECERDVTERWLLEARVWHERLYMRATDDTRRDDIIKEELLDRIIADGYDPKLVFDDRQRVVDMWRRRGLICAQVAVGDF